MAGRRASVAVRRPSPSSARSPTIAPEPTSATTSPSISTWNTPSRRTNRSRPGVSLLDERLAARDAAAVEHRALVEDRRREPALELRLDGVRERRRSLVSPRRAFAELELDRAEDIDESAVGVVERVAREGARRDEPRLGRPVHAHQQLERRPRRDGADVEVRASGDGPRRRPADPAADGLREADPAVADAPARAGSPGTRRRETRPAAPRAPGRRRSGSCPSGRSRRSRRRRPRSRRAARWPRETHPGGEARRGRGRRPAAVRRSARLRARAG